MRAIVRVTGFDDWPGSVSAEAVEPDHIPGRGHRRAQAARTCSSIALFMSGVSIFEKVVRLVEDSQEFKCPNVIPSGQGKRDQLLDVGARVRPISLGQIPRVQHDWSRFINLYDSAMQQFSGKFCPRRMGCARSPARGTFLGCKPLNFMPKAFDKVACLVPGRIWKLGGVFNKVYIRRGNHILL